MKKRKSKSSRDNYLPPELMSEVLARLPTKTLMKFRCVCKTWCSLIDSSDFISLHSKVHNSNSMNNAQLLAWEECDYIGYVLTLRRSCTFNKFRNLASLPKIHSVHGYCNGLMLISSRETLTSLILWNPSIRKLLLLPNPLKNNVIAYRLGFAPSSNDYKVLAIGRRKLVAIYSLNANCWRRISDPLNVTYYSYGFGSSFASIRVVYCGGALYWMDFEVKNLYSFDFNAEEFSVVQLPDSVKQSMFCFIFRIGDSIALFTMSSENSRVLIKNGGENSWRLWYSGEANSDICKLQTNKVTDILYLQKSNTFIISYKNFSYPGSPFYLRARRKLMSYNITSQEIKHLGKSIRGIMSFSPYVESLVLHKGFEGRSMMSFP